MHGGIPKLLVVVLLLLGIDANVIAANERAAAVNELLDVLAATNDREGVDVRVTGALTDELVLLLEEEEGVVTNSLVVHGDDRHDRRPGGDEHDGIAGLSIDDPFLEEALPARSREVSKRRHGRGWLEARQRTW